MRRPPSADAPLAGVHPLDVDPAQGPIPEDNLPGHHPEVEQDHPVEPPGVWRLRHGVGHTIPFSFEGWPGRVARTLGVKPEVDGLHLGAGRVCITFSRWTIDTPLDNVVGVAVTGPYWWPKIIGPPHLSLADRGVTFATTSALGLCLRFDEPVPGIVPSSVLRHPAATVTVEDPGAVAAVLLDEISRRG